MKKSLLVTGGAGYIGSHMCVELLQAGHDVVVVDNLSNSSAASLASVQAITQTAPKLHRVDLRDEGALRHVFESYSFDAVFHFAGLKAVGESVENPILYYDNNVAGTVALIRAMQSANVKTLVFSSSATVYGIPDKMPIKESTPVEPINPYGSTKLVIENMLHDVCQADLEWRISLLRYFNPVGAHPSGEIGESPTGVPGNLFPYVGQVAVGLRDKVSVFGGDYPTPDGTGIRDYVHVVDLVRGHVNALEWLDRGHSFAVHNLGTGEGYSVLEVIKAFERVSGLEIPFEIVGRRPGDVAVSFADAQLAKRDLNWSAQYDLDGMCEDAWRWQQQHPGGFEH